MTAQSIRIDPTTGGLVAVMVKASNDRIYVMTKE
jgi:hypothetical protein